MYDHCCIIWLSMLGDDKGLRAAVEGKNLLVFWYLVGF